MKNVSGELGDWFSTLMPLPPVLLLRDAEKNALISVPALRGGEQTGGALWPHMEPPQCS